MTKRFLLLHFSLLFALSGFAQSSEIELFGLYTWARPQSQIPLRGWGGGGNLLFHVCNIGPGKAPRPWRLQIGVGGYGSGFGRRIMPNIPLLPPQSGGASVRMQNKHAGGILFTRFSKPGISRIYYFDVFGGARYQDAQLYITPHNAAPGYEEETRINYSWTWALNGGLGAGVKQPIGKYIYIDAELLWSYTEKRSDFINMSSASGGADGLTFDVVRSPKNLMLLKAGFHFVLPDGGGGGGYSGDSSDSSNGSWNSGDSGSSGGDSGGGSSPNSIQINVGTPK